MPGCRYTPAAGGRKSGGPGGVRTLDLMTASHVKSMAGVDSKGPWLAADGRFYPVFSRSCGPDVAQKFAMQHFMFRSDAAIEES